MQQHHGGPVVVRGGEVLVVAPVVQKVDPELADVLAAEYQQQGRVGPHHGNLDVHLGGCHGIRFAGGGLRRLRPGHCDGLVKKLLVNDIKNKMFCNFNIYLYLFSLLRSKSCYFGSLCRKNRLIFNSNSCFDLGCFIGSVFFRLRLYCLCSSCVGSIMFINIIGDVNDVKGLTLLV